MLVRRLQAVTFASLWSVLAACCGSGAQQPAGFPEPGQTVAFAQIRVAGMRASTLTIREVDESGSGAGGRVAAIRARQGTRTYAIFLPPGQYSVAGVQDPGDPVGGGSLMGGTLVFEIAPGKASYFGAFDMLIESGRFCAVDLSDGAFQRAAADFRKRHPHLAARFETVNAVARTDRIEAHIEQDGGVEQ